MTWGEVEAGIGRRAAVIAGAAVVAGVAAVASGLGPAARSRTVAALIASWLFFAGLATGGAAFRAFFRIVRARWARRLVVLGGIQASSLPAAAAVLVLVLAWGFRAPWVAEPTGWLSPGNVATRQLVANAILLGLAYFGIRARGDREEAPSTAAAIAYCIVFAVVLSLWAFDFVLGPDPVWGSTIIGAYMFMAAFAGGTGVTILVALGLGALGERERRDAGALVFALSIFWLYLVWSQFLTMWYANLPEEIVFGIRRATDGWGSVLFAAIVLAFVVPFFGLIHHAGRTWTPFFAAVLVAQLVGLWLACHLLVVPSLTERGTSPLTLRDLLIAAGMLGAYALLVAPAIGHELAGGHGGGSPAGAAAVTGPDVARR
jgi:hypothetical protein